MPVTAKIAGEILAEIRSRTEGFEERLKARRPSDEPLPPAVPRDDAGGLCTAERRELLRQRGHALSVVTGERTVVPDDGFRGNVENFVGLVQVPLGVVGPLRINGLHAHGDFYLPLATTEGALVASHARGVAAISRAGGARAACLMERVSRAPLFHFKNLVEAGHFVAFALDTLPHLREVAAQTSEHGRLVDLRIHWDGNLVYLICDYTTGAAAGQNMVTLATERVARHLAEAAPDKPDFWTVESNLSGDKKASIQAFQYVRGKMVTAEVELPRDVVEQDLRTTPEAMERYWKAAFVAGAHAGTIGGQGQFANGLAALFLACGQDVACVAEAAVGTTRLELTEAGDLYASVYLPGLICGTVGGGTGLPTARECLALLECAGQDSAAKFAEIAACLVLAGELSLSAAITAGHFSSAHATLGRKGPSPTPPGRA
jgi:hydroxymethylglutaryl-CoA reductase (NADPH)